MAAMEGKGSASLGELQVMNLKEQNTNGRLKAVVRRLGKKWQKFEVRNHIRYDIESSP